MGSEDLKIQPELVFGGHQFKLVLLFMIFLILLTCDLAHGEVVSRATLGVPGCPFDTVRGSRLQAIKGQHGVGGIDFVAGVGALSDDAERVQDGVLH